MRDPHGPQGLRRRLALHVLTDGGLSRGRGMLVIAREALAGGATVIQLRDKTSSTRRLVEQGMALRRLTREHGALLIVNDRIDVALAVDADGAHVGQDDMPAELARRLLGPHRILGLSAGNEQEVEAAIAVEPDYLSIGPVNATSTKPDAGPPLGLRLLKETAARRAPPLIAIGGMTADNAGDAIRGGAVGVAVVSAVVGAEDVAAAARSLSRAVLHALADMQSSANAGSSPGTKL